MRCQLLILVDAWNIRHYYYNFKFIMYLMFFKQQQPQTKEIPTYPQSINIDAVQQRKMPFKQVASKQKVCSSQSLQGTNLIQEYILVTIQDPVEQSDPTVALILNITPIPNQKKRFLDIQTFETFLLNYGGTDFPSGISLCVGQLGGYSNQKGVNTNVIGNSCPAQISTVLNQGGIIGYNVLYVNKEQNIWDITGINTLTFKIKLFGDNMYRPLPTSQPIQLSLKISRVVF